MNSFVITAQSIYWLFLIIGISGAITYLLYYKNLISSDLDKSKSLFLSIIRFFSLIFIGFLLLGPLIKIITSKTQKPIVIIANDNSQSMVLSKDSTFLRDSFPGLLNTLEKKLSEKYDVHTLQFGDSVNSLSATFTHKETNFESLFNEFNTTFFNRNVGALIIASDGLYNKGINPLYASQNLPFPIYTVPFGDTVLNTDIAISKVDYNKVAFKGSKFPVMVSVLANLLQGKTVKVDITDNSGKVIKSQNIIIDNNSFFKKIPFYLNADSSGIFEYTVKAAIDGSELNLLNNTKKIYVQVEENKRKILLLQNGYHPDVAVFKRIIEATPEFEIDISNTSEFKKDILDYALVILHQLPSNSNNLQKVLPALVKNEIPLLFVFGKETSVKSVNNLDLLLNIDQKNNLFDDALPTINKEFTLFNTTVDNHLISEMTPLYVPFGLYNNMLKNHVLLYQKIGQIETRKPLWAFNETGQQKVGFILGEGLWKWRLREYKEYRDHSITDELVVKTIQYLALKNRKDPFVINYPKTIGENQEIHFNAKLLNASNELVKDAVIQLNIFDNEGNKYTYTFEQTNNSYSVNIGVLNIGKYAFKVSTQLGNIAFNKTGTFIVKENMIEQTNLIADYNMLYKLSINSNGKQIDKYNIVDLVNIIEENTNIAPVVYIQKTLRELIHLKWLFVLLAFMLGAEWFFRKFWGII